MKKVLVALCVLFLLTGALTSQITDVKVSSGQSALAYGTDISANITNPNDPSQMLSVEFNSTLGQAIFLKNYSSGISIGPSGGIWHNTVWVAPFISYSPTDFITFTSWNGVISGKQQKSAWSVAFAFAYHAIDIKVKDIGVGYSILHDRQKKPMQMPSFKYTYFYSANDQFIYSFTYELITDCPMHLVAYKHIF